MGEVRCFSFWYLPQQENDPNGSDTRGLQNYDDLYADVLMWINNGWVDYNIPQIYWEIGHPAADYDNLIHWWAKHAASRPLFIGQDVMRTVNKADARNPLQTRCLPNEVATVASYRAGKLSMVCCCSGG